jgi:hypothetical protein
MRWFAQDVQNSGRIVMGVVICRKLLERNGAYIGDGHRVVRQPRDSDTIHCDFLS